MIHMTEYIKSVKSYSSTEYEMFVYERDRAFRSLNYDRIKYVYDKYRIPCPEDTPENWIKIALSVLDMEDASSRQKKNARIVLDELNVNAKKGL